MAIHYDRPHSVSFSVPGGDHTLKIEEQPYMAYRNLATSVLIVHQQRDDGHCLCGKLRLGDSWAEHVADILHNVGALRDKPPHKD